MKDDRERRLFCQCLRNQLVGQKAIRNRTTKKRDVFCSAGTLRVNDQTPWKVWNEG